MGISNRESKGAEPWRLWPLPTSPYADFPIRYFTQTFVSRLILHTIEVYLAGLHGMAIISAATCGFPSGDAFYSTPQKTWVMIPMTSRAHSALYT